MADLASRITKPDDKPADAAPTAGDAADATPNTDATPTPDAQVDGAPEALGGSGLHEPEWDVEVSLSDLQNNEATPFHSATNWEDLGL